MEYILRKQPLFSITLGDQDFTVVDHHRKGQSGTFRYDGLKTVRLREKQVNIFIVLLSLCIGEGGTVKKEPWRLDIIVSSKQIRFYPEEDFLFETKLVASNLLKKC